MLTRTFIGLALALATTTTNAQRPDCPLRDAPTPMSPPGKPPDFMPNFTPPLRFGDPVKVEPMVVLPRAGELVDAEEGHATRVARMVEHARAKPPPPEVLKGLVDTGKTALAQWRFHGYVPDSPRHKVPRVYSRDGSVLVFEQWNMAADGASIAGAPPQTEPIGRSRGHFGGLRTPSGCINASLSWQAGGISYMLQIVGPRSHQAQRELLLEVAHSIEAAS